MEDYEKEWFLEFVKDPYKTVKKLLDDAPNKGIPENDIKEACDFFVTAWQEHEADIKKTLEGEEESIASGELCVSIWSTFINLLGQNRKAIKEEDDR